MRGLRILVSTAALLAGVAMAPTAQAQISINIGVQPTCAYGYYGYAPYGCAPRGYYGSGYFYNGIFVGMGPWSGYGYSHGWGGHRFVNDGGGSYHGGVSHAAYHDNQGNKGNKESQKSYPQQNGGKPHAGNPDHGGSNEKPHGGNDHQ